MEGTISTASRHDFGRLVLLLGAGHLLAFADRAKIAGALPAIRRQVAMSDTAAGWVIGTAFAAGYGATVLLLALAARRQGGAGDGGRWSWRLPAGSALWAAASLASGLAGSAAALIAARALVGAGQALFIPAALSWLVTAGDAAGRRASGLARFTAAASLGRSLGLLAIGAAIALMGGLGAGTPGAWRWSFGLTVLPNLVLLTLLCRRPRHAPSPAAPSVATVRPAPDAGGWTRPAYLLLALLPIVVIQAFGGWLPTLLAQQRGVSPQGAAAWAGTLALVGGAGSQLVAGWLLQRLPRWQEAAPLVIAGGLVAALPGLALLGWGPGAASATVGALLATLATGLASFAGLLGWQRLTPAGERTTGNGLFMALVTVAGVGLGPLVTGILADHGGTHGLALRGALMATAAACAALSAPIAWAVQPGYRRHGRA